MPKIKRQNFASAPEIVYSKEELLELDKELKAAGGEKRWLIKQGAIRLNEFGEKVIMAKVTGQTDDGKNIYDIPFARLNEKLKQLDKLRDRLPWLFKQSVL